MKVAIGTKRGWLGILAGAVAICTAPLQAAEYTWNGTSGSWNDSAKWGGEPYNNADDVGLVNSGQCKTDSTTFKGRLNINSGGELYGVAGTTATGDNIHLNGGRLNSTLPSATTLSGAIAVDADSYLDGEKGDFNIHATLSGSGNLERRSGNNNYVFWSAHNSYSGNWTVTSGTLTFKDSPGSGEIAVNGGTLQIEGLSLTNKITINAGGSLFPYVGAQATTLDDLHLNGGSILKSLAQDATLNGTISVDAASTLKANGSRTMIVNAAISGNKRLTRIADSYNANFKFTGDNSNFSGGWEQGPDGVLIFTTVGSIGTGDIVADGVVALEAAQNWDFPVDISSGSSLQVGTTLASETSRTITFKGASVAPGNNVGIFSVRHRYPVKGDVHAVFDVNEAAERCMLAIDVADKNGVAGTDYDQLTLLTNNSGELTGLSNADLVVNIDPALKSGDLDGQVLTIVLCANDLTSQEFNSVSFGDSWDGTVNYENGAIKLSDLRYREAGTVIMLH